MSKRLIGIEIGGGKLRVATLTWQKGQLSIAALLEKDYADDADLGPLLGETLAGEFRIGDQLIACLPARSAYVRQLEFPFQDEKKIAAAIPFELSSQLPVPIESCATAIRQAQKTGTGAKVSAAAVPLTTFEALLGLFEQADVPLHQVDLAPFCYVAGLGEQIGDGLLVCATGREITLALVQNGRLADYRMLPAGAGAPPAWLCQQLAREIKLLRHAAGQEALPVSLMGEGATPELAAALQGSEGEVAMLAVEIGDQRLEGVFLPALATALRGRLARNDRSFNFRQGRYALKGEWANLKRKLVLLAGLVGMAALIMVGSMSVKYLDKAGRAQQLQEEMVSIYRGLFPAATTIVDVPLQLQSAIREQQEKSSLLAGSQVSPLAILKEISGLPNLAAVEVQEYSLDATELKLAGRADSFETVNQVVSTLGASALFARAQVTDSKMSLDGSRVDFRLLLSLADRGEQP